MKKLLLIAIIVACGNNQAHAMAQAQVQEGFILQTLRNCDQIFQLHVKLLLKQLFWLEDYFLSIEWYKKSDLKKLLHQ
jgi:hypothetical protein